MGKAFTGIEHEPDSGLEIEEGDRPVFEFFSDDAFCFESKTIRVEADGLFQVIDADCMKVIRGFMGSPPA